MKTKTYADGYDAWCIEAEKTLCELKGWSVTVDERGSIWHAADKNFCEEIPMWTRIDADCFALMAEYDCHPMSINDIEVTAGWIGADQMSIVAATCIVKDFPDKGAAIRLAIVKAVIDKLLKLKQKT